MLGPPLLAPPPTAPTRIDRASGLMAGWWSSTTSGVGTVVPDGGIDLLWMPGRVPVIAGPDVVPRPVDLPAGRHVIGVRLLPGVASQIVGDGADRMVGLQVPLDQAWSRQELDRLIDELGRSVGDRPEEAVGVLARAIDRRVSASWTPDPIVVAAVRAITTGAPQQHHGLSPRQLRRRFTASMGYGPALFGRIARLDRFTELLDAEPDRTLAELAAEVGFADQAHLNRDCRALLGVTPGELRRPR